MEEAKNILKKDLEVLKDKILKQNPTLQQQDAIFSEDIEFLLRAVPGSGKTWTSCRRFIWRGANWPYSAGGLALLSFTNTAVKEFQSATIDVGKRHLLSDPNYVGTFDAFVERFILAPFGHLIFNLNKRPKLFIAPRPGDRKNKKLMAWTTVKGAQRQVPAWEIVPFPEDGNIDFKASWSRGGEKLQFTTHNPVDEFIKLGYYTHNQRVYWACRLLSERPHLAKCISGRFPEIIVDEAQDSNVWLLILLEHLREHGSKITLIGDPDQCIYEFSMADATSLLTLKDKWNIPEIPLTHSFRCNERIADSVINIGSNTALIGINPSIHTQHIPFIFRDSCKHFSESIVRFSEMIQSVVICESKSAIICRGHSQLESTRGSVNYSRLKGLTRELATASFLRDIRRDFKAAYKKVEYVVRQVLDNDALWEMLDDFPDSEESMRIKLEIWRFTKSPSGLPSITLEGSKWIEAARQGLSDMISNVDPDCTSKLSQKIKKTGLLTDTPEPLLFESRPLFPSIRQATIHQVKDESIDAVLVLGSTQFWNAVIKAIDNTDTSEERRLAYVAMTRARHLLVLGLPKTHFDIHSKKWESWNFSILE